jgi:hypothetical protein
LNIHFKLKNLSTITAIYGGFWTGLYDKKDEMAFEWSDGMEVSYTTWADREPNNMGLNGQDCVMIKLLVSRSHYI